MQKLSSAISLCYSYEAIDGLVNSNSLKDIGEFDCVNEATSLWNNGEGAESSEDDYNDVGSESQLVKNIYQ